MVLFSSVCWAEEKGEQDDVLRWMGHWKGEGQREALVLEVFDEFQFLHPEVAVELTFATDILPVKTQRAAGEYISDMIRSGDVAWDVVWMDTLIYNAVAEHLEDPNWGEKHLVDFSAIPDIKQRQKPFLVEGGEANPYPVSFFSGPYIEGYYYTVWYNRAVARRLGLSIKEEGMTAQDLLSYVRAVHEYNAEAEKPVSAFMNISHAGSSRRLFYALLCSAWKGGVADVDEAYEKTEGLFAELSAYEPYLNGSENVPWPDAGDRFLKEDRALFIFDATWRFNAFEKEYPEKMQDLGLAQLPSLEGHICKIGGYLPTWAVMKASPNRELGIELMRYWSRPSIAQKWVRYTKSPTGLKGDFYDSTFGGDPHAEYQRRLNEKSDMMIMDPFVFRSEKRNVFGPEIFPERITRSVAELEGSAVQ